MIVVADSSPLIVPIDIGHIEVLPRLFGQVIIPPEISVGLNVPTRPQVVRQFIGARPNWLLEQVPTRPEPIATLHPGEVAAVRLAQELKADLLLIDEVRGRKARGGPLTLLSPEQSEYLNWRRPKIARVAGCLCLSASRIPTSGFRPNCLMSDSSSMRP